MEAATEFYVQALCEGSSGIARTVLRERGVSGAAANMFSLGFSPFHPGSLISYLEERNFTRLEAVEAGIFSLNQINRERPCDRFFGRLIIPIRNTRGLVVGFGGRVLPPREKDQERNDPKYINSPDSPIFRKRNTLFGLSLARPTVKKGGKAVIVEGYFDVIALHAAGVSLSLEMILPSKKYSSMPQLIANPLSDARSTMHWAHWALLCVWSISVTSRLPFPITVCSELESRPLMSIR